MWRWHRWKVNHRKTPKQHYPLVTLGSGMGARWRLRLTTLAALCCVSHNWQKFKIDKTMSSRELLEGWSSACIPLLRPADQSMHAIHPFKNKITSPGSLSRTQRPVFMVRWIMKCWKLKMDKLPRTSHHKISERALSVRQHHTGAVSALKSPSTPWH